MGCLIVLNLSLNNDINTQLVLELEMKSRFLFYFCLMLSFGTCATAIELEEMAPGIVLQVKQIHIPDYPFAFNPSIVRWKGMLLMSFRDIYEPCYVSDLDSAGYSMIGLVFVDENINPISPPQFLDLQGESFVLSRAEDPRLITVEDRLYIIYSDNQEEMVSKGGYRMRVAELQFDGYRFSVKSLDRMLHFEGEDRGKREKNWVPFEYDGGLLFAYSIAPHHVMRPILGHSSCETIAKTHGTLNWKWGELRGGTPGLLINEGQYLAFFHSSTKMATNFSEGECIPHYFMGAYLYSAHPPFEITQKSPYPIINNKFYTDNVYIPYWKPLNVIFPGGFIHDDRHIWVVYGRHDHEVWAVKFDKQALLDTLIPVQCLSTSSF